MIRITIFSLLLLAGNLVCSPAQNKKPKKKFCNASDIAGIWYGTYESVGGSVYQMSMEIQVDENCKISGYQYWPEYYNSKSSISGTLEGNELRIAEEAVVMGYHSATGLAQTGMVLQDTLKLTVWNENGGEIARLTLADERIIPLENLSVFQAIVSDNAAKFGTVEILDDTQEFTIEEIFRIQKDLYSADDSAFSELAQTMKISGMATLKQFEVPLKGYIKRPDKQLIEVEFQGLKFINASNGTIDWEYNPFDDVLETSKAKEKNQNSDFSFMTSDLYQQDLEDFSFASLKNARLDSLDTFRLLLKTDQGEWVVYYLDKRTKYVVRTENKDGVKYSFDYKDIHGLPMATAYHELSLSDYNKYRLDQVELGIELPDSLFEIPARFLSKIKQQSPRDHGYYADIGEKAYQNENYQAAVEAYTQAINLQGYASYYHSRGRARMELEQFYEAISDFTVVLEVEAENAEAFNDRGLAKYYLKDYQNAIKDLDQAVKFDSTMKSAYNNRLYTHFNLGEIEEGLKDIDKLLALEPEDGSYLTYYGILLAQLDRYDEALEKYRQALVLGHQDNEIYNYKGVSHYNLEQYDSAIVSFELALARDTSNTQILTNLANSHFKLQQYQQVVKYLHECLKFDPENPESLNSLGYVLQLLEDYETSLAYLDKAIELNNEQAEYFSNRAQSRYGMSLYLEALEDLNTAIDLDSSDGNSYYLRGLVKVTMNDKYDACRDFQKAQELGQKEAAEKIESYCITGGDSN